MCLKISVSPGLILGILQYSVVSCRFEDKIQMIIPLSHENDVEESMSVEEEILERD